MLIVEINVQFHLFQEVTNQFTVVIVSDNTNQMIQEMIDIQETIEVQDHHMDENQVEIVLDQENQEMTNFQKNKRAFLLMVQTNFMKRLKKNYLKFWVEKLALIVDLKMKELWVLLQYLVMLQVTMVVVEMHHHGENTFQHLILLEKI